LLEKRERIPILLKMNKVRHPEKQKNQSNPIKKKPAWIKSKLLNSKEFFLTKSIVNQQKLVTVCEEANCPNITECWSKRHATFMIMGDTCTRACAFCDVKTGRPEKLDPFEPKKIALAVKRLNLRHVVITSVDRDDLKDGGSNHFYETIKSTREANPETTIEVLTPDLWGGGKNLDETNNLQTDRLKMILEKDPICFNHNLETVERLQKEVRRGANYKKSLSLLKKSKDIAPHIQTKSGIMLGLGETLDEIKNTIYDLKKIDCDQITIGQYLRPSFNHLAVKKYWDPSEFEYLYRFSKELGFKKVSSGPLVRRSYHAG